MDNTAPIGDQWFEIKGPDSYRNVQSDCPLFGLAGAQIYSGLRTRYLLVGSTHPAGRPNIPPHSAGDFFPQCFQRREALGEFPLLRAFQPFFETGGQS